MDLSLFQYHLPPELIATEPANPRDSARLMVVNTRNQTVHMDIMSNLEKWLPKNAFLIFNETKVFPARIHGKLSGEKEVELLIMDFNDKEVRATANRKMKTEDRVFLPENVAFEALETHEKIFVFKPSVDAATLQDLLEKHGETPLPHYIHSPLPESVLREKYQSVFAKKTGSVAAPTASLHFTPELLNRLAANGQPCIKVTLHVGLGTFAPVLPEHLAENRLHCEAYEIDEQEMTRYKNLRAEGRAAIAVGSTVTRTLESALQSGKNSGQTEIFIRPPYEFQAIDGLITNFHLPGSSLMMLVQAFLEWKGFEKSLVELYQIAIQEKMRFYSFGDGMLIV